MHGDSTLPLPGLVHSQAFADGPTRWYARRGSIVLSGASQVDVLGQIWDQDEAALTAFVSKLALASPDGLAAQP